MSKKVAGTIQCIKLACFVNNFPRFYKLPREALAVIKAEAVGEVLVGCLALPKTSGLFLPLNRFSGISFSTLKRQLSS